MTHRSKVYAGCSVWGAHKFVGSLYPRSTEPKDFLRVYSTQFNAVELNSTGYRFPESLMIKSWTAQAPEGFIFCPRLTTRLVTMKPIVKDLKALRSYCDAIHFFEDHLGTVFMPLPKNFNSDRFEELLTFFEAWDSQLPLFVEMSDQSWFVDSKNVETTLDVMRSRNIGIVATDLSRLTNATLVPKSAYIRYFPTEGRSDESSLQEWVNKVHAWLENGLETVYFFAHSPNKLDEPIYVNSFLNHLNAIGGYSLKLAMIAQKESSSSTAPVIMASTQ